MSVMAIKCALSQLNCYLLVFSFYWHSNMHHNHRYGIPAKKKVSEGKRTFNATSFFINSTKIKQTNETVNAVFSLF